MINSPQIINDPQCLITVPEKPGGFLENLLSEANKVGLELGGKISYHGGKLISFILVPIKEQISSVIQIGNETYTIPEGEDNIFVNSNNETSFLASSNCSSEEVDGAIRSYFPDLFTTTAAPTTTEKVVSTTISIVSGVTSLVKDNLVEERDDAEENNSIGVGVIVGVAMAVIAISLLAYGGYKWYKYKNKENKQNQVDKTEMAKWSEVMVSVGNDVPVSEDGRQNEENEQNQAGVTELSRLMVPASNNKEDSLFSGQPINIVNQDGSNVTFNVNYIQNNYNKSMVLTGADSSVSEV